MSKMKNLTILTILLIVVGGCSTHEFIGYNTEANLTYESHSNNTSLILMKILEKSGGSKDYSVVDCMDRDSTEYILLAPTIDIWMGLKYSISTVDFKKAVTLKDHYAKELIKRVKFSIDNWDNKYIKFHGVSYEYTCGLKNKHYDINNAQNAWLPVAKYYFQNSSNGPLAVLQLGLNAQIYKFNFDTIEKVKDFYDRLQKAVNNHKFNL